MEMNLTIDEMVKVIRKNVKGAKMHVRELNIEGRQKANLIAKHHHDCFILLDRATLPRKAEVRRIMKMSERLLEKITKL